MDEMEDDMPQLSGDTLTALQEFYSERDIQQKRFENLKAEVEQKCSHGLLSMELFSEDWNASQFWYSDETATALAKQLLEGGTTTTYIAVVSAPSVFIQLKNLLASGMHGCPNIYLLEFDERFNVFKEFIHYDFQSPLKLPSELKGRFDRILCDPPFLSSDCQIKAAMTVRWLSKTITPSDTQIPRLIFCTGERMEGLILRLHPGVKTTTFEPQHAQDRLSNDFRCYSNFETDIWSWR